ncbi:MoaD/ThiS family protein [Mucilaginibacter segetis]|uniref:Molybdopterin synthase sulfur carrier subunit n=1 Tax=Mucilaginibacter segetis TaxID=2793071 RepID=A0A934UM50_9SPHI|nr:MoaD/ThiS family protein [Mucilaginibacter segetis]MBK0379044.1 MoaD/ThiS family protein [Mucilaginibacter segetis]
MQIKILAFGIAKDIFGSANINVELRNNAKAEELKDLLEEKYPKLKQLASYMLAINNEYAQNDSPISITDEVAVIPPVSGG